MKPVAKAGRKKRVIMEVVGEDGKKAYEYVDDGNDSFIPPYVKVDEAIME